MREVRELVKKFREYASTCSDYSCQFEKTSPQAEYHRSAAEAFRRCADELESALATAPPEQAKCPVCGDTSMHSHTIVPRNVPVDPPQAASAGALDEQLFDLVAETREELRPFLVTETFETGTIPTTYLAVDIILQAAFQRALASHDQKVRAEVLETAAQSDCCGHSRADHASDDYDLTGELGECLTVGCACKAFRELTMEERIAKLPRQTEIEMLKRRIRELEDALGSHDQKARDDALEYAAQIADEHWPESGHIHEEDAVSCQMSISVAIRRAKSIKKWEATERERQVTQKVRREVLEEVDKKVRELPRFDVVEVLAAIRSLASGAEEKEKP